MRKHLNPSTILSIIALVVAVGGGSAYAGVTIAKNSVGTEQLRTGAVRSSDIRNGSVGVADLSKAARNAATPTKAKLASVVEDVITDPKSGVNITVKGEKGPQGDQGPQGAQGPAGVPTIATLTQTQTWGTSVTGSGTATFLVTCPEGTAVSGGGFSYTPAASADILQSYPSGARQWTVVAKTSVTGATVTGTAYAVCVTSA